MGERIRRIKLANIIYFIDIYVYKLELTSMIVNVKVK